MANQTEYVENLRNRMEKSFNDKYYLESIVCSYAIIENRTKRICEHLGLPAKSKTLDIKTKNIYNAIKNKDLENSKKKKKLIGFLEHRIKGTNLLGDDFSKEYEMFNNGDAILTLENQLISFRRVRNKVIHNMYKYDSTNPRLTNFDEFRDLAEAGIYVARNLCTIASAMKRKKI